MFGRFKKDKRITEAAVAARAELATLTEADKAPMRDALARRWARPVLGAATRQDRHERRPAVRADDLPEPVPQSVQDTMIVSSAAAWATYQRTAAFLCEPGRELRPVRFVAFSVDGQLQREIPRIIAIRDDVPFTSAEQRRLMWSGTELDLRLADVIATARRLGMAGERHQVYLLTAPAQAGHVTIPAEVARWASRRRHLPFVPRRSVTRSGHIPISVR